MKRQRKNLFGILGLFAVAAVTAYASCLPTPEANATANGTTTITVNVINKTYPTANITNPKDGDVIYEPDVDLKFTFTYADYYIIKIKNNRTGDFEEFRIEPEDKDGSDTKSFNLDEYGEIDDSFTFTVTAYSEDAFGEDSVTISYKKKEEPGPIIPDEPDPIIPEEPEEPIDVPNTGGFFGTLNISKTDYLITGLIAFFILSGGLLVYLKKSKNRR